MKPIVGMKIKFNTENGEYVIIGKEYTLVTIEGNTVYVKCDQGQTYINWKRVTKENICIM
jgi:hypothetical protein